MHRSASILALLCLVAIARAASIATTTPQQDAELDEILVDGRRPVTEPRRLVAWIDRLVGEFSYEGHVERYDAGGMAQRTDIHGDSRCVRFGRAVAVQCMVTSAPPSPAVIVYGLNSTKRFFGSLQVDGNGVATGGKGWLVDDTLVSTGPCADFADCLRTVRLEAPPDAKEVRIRIDLEQGGMLRQREEVRWKRERRSQATPFSTATTTTPSPVPPDIESWLRQLPGQYRIPGLDEHCAAKPQAPRAGSGSLDAFNEPSTCPRSEAAREALKNRPADAECLAVGSGAGLRCVVNMPWPESGTPLEVKWFQTLNPHYLMYGFDPVHQGIALALVSPTSSVGSAGFTTGLIKDGKLSYMTECAQPPCTAVEEVSFAPGGDWVQWRISRGPGTPDLLTWRMFRMQQQEPGAGKATTGPKRAAPSPRRN